MRGVWIPVGLMLLAGCAGEPRTAAAPASSPAATGGVAVPATSTAAESTKSGSTKAESTKYVATTAAAQPEPATLEQAMKMGYKVVNERGATLYCREDRQLGSHLKKERTCLTAEELAAARESNQRNFDNMKKTIQPPQGK